MAADPAQIPFALDHPVALGVEDFLIAPGNEVAMDWIRRWPDWPGSTLALSGPEGCGKSHLAAIFAKRSGASIVFAAALADPLVPVLAEKPALVVEDGDRGCDDEALLHLYNLRIEQRRPTLLTGRLPPARWPVGLKDLSSRLATVPLAEIGPPDDALLDAVLAKLFADRQLVVGPEVLSYLRLRMERSFAAARVLVDRIDRTSLAQGRAVTVPLLRQILE